ncbi:MAG: hypothetical protein LAT63_05120 [Marinobacter sp.]|nr:hypothetical protein [Marinobacter sp.]
MPTALQLDRWYALLPDTDQPSAELAIARLLTRYQEPHRAYHTLDHITACLAHLDAHWHTLDNPQAAALALWYHDAVYDTRRQDNEARSADLARKELSALGINPHQCEDIHNLIMVTRHPSQPHNADARYLLDIDLAILGASPQAFARYEQQVRQEYHWVPEHLYCEGRGKLLQSLLAAPTPYHTAVFRDSHEVQARANLTQSLRQLQAGQCPAA